MHHKRATHNAHNETQRRLKKNVKKYISYHMTPRYVSFHYGKFSFGDYLEPDWYQWGNIGKGVVTRVHSSGEYLMDSLEGLEHLKENLFYKKKSKSSGPKSTWRFYKKLLHRRWRRKAIDELTFTYKDARGCSLRDFY